MFLKKLKNKYLIVASRCPMCDSMRLIEKDHGSWVGEFCPDCRYGGSRSKNKKPAFVVKRQPNYKWRVECATSNKKWMKDFETKLEAENYAIVMENKYRAKTKIIEL